MGNITCCVCPIQLQIVTPTYKLYNTVVSKWAEELIHSRSVLCVCVCVCVRERERERGREREVKAVNNTLVPKAQLGVRCISISEIIVSTHIHTHTHTCMHAHTHTHTRTHTHIQRTHDYIKKVLFSWFFLIMHGFHSLYKVSVHVPIVSTSAPRCYICSLWYKDNLNIMVIVQRKVSRNQYTWKET